jgi:hypothetical protein
MIGQADFPNSAIAEVFNREARILQYPEKQTSGQILPTVDWDNHCFSRWMLQDQMGASLAVLGVSVTGKKTQEFASSRHYSIATETVSV